MQRAKIEEILLSSNYPEDLIKDLLNAYIEGIEEYKKNNWRYAGQSFGRFIEYARRLLIIKIENRQITATEKLDQFTDAQLKRWESAQGDVREEYKIIIPRVLYAMTCIRNKRDIAHVNAIEANRSDITWMMYSAKWVLAEFIRLSSKLSIDETSELVSSIMLRESSLIWETPRGLKILDPKMTTNNKVLCHLYLKDNQLDSQLQQTIGYKNKTNFNKKILQKLHEQMLIDYVNHTCSLTPLGAKEAEKILTKMDE